MLRYSDRHIQLPMNYRCSRGSCLVALLLVCWTLPPGVSAQSTNGVLREFYAGVGNGSLQAFTNSPSFPASPTSEFVEAAFFEAPSSIGDNYGQRMRALLLPPVTGNYVFYIATDDQGALFLSSDESPNTRVKIASVPTWAGSRVWQEPRDGNDVAQKSAPIFLTAGNRYYIEALQTEGGGGDNLAVGWQKPGDPVPPNGSDPIPGAFLIPYGLSAPIITTQPANLTVTEGNIATFNVQLARMLGAVFQWSRNGTNIPGAVFNTYSFGPVTLADTSNRFRCFVANSLGSTNSTEAILTVVADTTKPTLATVGNIGENQIVFVVFSEPVEMATATNVANYTINNGIGVTRAAFGVDSRTIILSTTPLSQNVTYTLTVNNVRDRASSPNTILANSTRTFSLTSTPLDVSFLSLPREPLGPST